MGLSSGSTPTLPYSHGQTDFSSLTPSSSSIPIPSLPTPISQNVTLKHFPLSSFSSNFPYHTSFQPSLTSLPDPPPYPKSILPSLLSSTLQGNLLPSVHPQSIPLLSSNLLAGSSFSFHQQTFFPHPFLNLWPSHPIYHPQPIYATSHSLRSLSSSSLSTFSTNTFTTSSNIIPTFTTASSISSPSSSGSSKRRPTRGWQRAGEDVTLITLPQDLIPKPLLLIPLLLLIWTFPPQILPGLVSPSIFVLMVL